MMMSQLDQGQAPVPTSSLVLGYGPIVPLVLAAMGVWLPSSPLSEVVTKLAIIWGGLILVFVAGVRRGYGFGDPKASARTEIATMLVYFFAGGISLVIAAFGAAAAALAVQLGAYIIVAVWDRRAAFGGDAPLYFARLRGTQMAVAAGSLSIVLVHTLINRP